jgi:hypothetical protein
MTRRNNGIEVYAAIDPYCFTVGTSDDYRAEGAVDPERGPGARIFLSVSFRFAVYSPILTPFLCYDEEYK